MDGDFSGLSSYFSAHHHRHFAEGVASSSTAGKGIFLASGDANPFAISQAACTGASVAPAPSPASQAESVKRKRGRPRKYGALSSSASISLPSSAAAKASPSLVASSPDCSFGRKEVSSTISSTNKAQIAALGYAGQGFTPHVILISDGEDVVAKLLVVVRQGNWAVSILSATGSILNPSLRHPAASSANITYEGKFDIISLSGLVIYSEAGGAFSSTGGLGICLSSVDGGIVGGAVGGTLIAAGPVQVIAGSFLIEAEMDSNASTKVSDYPGKLSSALFSGGSTSMSAGGTLTFRGSGFLTGKWNSTDLSGTSQPVDEEDEEDIRD
ncbi:Putative DNA-binding protein ESCAROLA [Apostasia shenzhenica]|uniref:AT-hook motif nuclear-localized protein n=1 Tax=Apostasia shenzhenica TaxID=1088818 RepID=A0A2I0B2R8_9ASPA|nr:Putative DNA-binding protein ESCAROLA [Apostasia shenzhenica]